MTKPRSRRIAGKPRESWLASQDVQQWADAMMCCQWGDGRCGADGVCHLHREDGHRSCFRPARSGVTVDGREIERMTAKQLRRAIVEMDTRLHAEIMELFTQLLRYQDEIRRLGGRP